MSQVSQISQMSIGSIASNTALELKFQDNDTLYYVDSRVGVGGGSRELSISRSQTSRKHGGNVSPMNEFTQQLTQVKSSNVNSTGQLDVNKFLIRICVILFGMILGCSICISWWYNSVVEEIEIAMEYTISSVQETAINKVDYSLRTPLALNGIMNGLLYTNDIPKDGTSLINGSYNHLLFDFHNYDPSDAVYQVLIYIDSENNTDAALGFAYLDPNQPHSTVWTYDGSVGYQEIVGYNSSVAYSPRDRPWYSLAMTLDEGVRKWTDIYTFAFADEPGISLVETIYYEGVRIIFVVEYLVSDLNSVLDSIAYSLPLPELNGVLYLVADNSSNTSNTSNTGNSGNDYAILAVGARNEFVSEYNEVLKDSFYRFNEEDMDNNIHRLGNGWLLRISRISIAWPMTLQMYFSGSNVTQEAYFVALYSNDYLYDIDDLLDASIAGFVSIVCIIIIFMVSLKYFDSYATKYKEFGQKFVLYALKTQTYCILFLKFVLIGIFIIIYYEQEGTTDDVFDKLIVNTMVKTEYKQAHNAFKYQITDNIEFISNLIETRISGIGLQVLDYEGLSNGIINVDEAVNETEAFLTNLQNSLTSSDGRFNQYGIYLATPNGSIHGAKTHYNVENNSIAGIHIYRRNVAQEDDALHLYTTNEHGLAANEETTSQTYDPRCRIWYQSAIKYGFSGSWSQAFPISKDHLDYFLNDNGSPGDAYQCTVAVEKYESIFGSNYSEGIDVEKTSEIVWTRYTFETITNGGEASIGLAATKCFINKTTNELVAIVLIDYLLDDLSTFLNRVAAINSDTDDSNDNMAWIIESNDTDGRDFMLASSDGETTETVHGLEGLSCVDNSAKKPYAARDSPNDDINIFSQLVLDATGVDSLPVTSISVNTSKNDSSVIDIGINSKVDDVSVQIETPIDYPYVESGRIKYIPGRLESGVGLDAVLIKIVDMSDLIATNVDAQTITLGVSILIVICIVFLDRRLASDKLDTNVQSKYSSYTRRRINGKVYTGVARQKKRDFKDMREDWYQIIVDCTNVYWQEYISNKSCQLITLKEMESFTLKYAKRYLSFQNIDNPMALCDECCLATQNENVQFKRIDHFITFELGNYKIYKFFVQAVILSHVFSLFNEPDTPEKLKKEGWSGNLAAFVAFCIVIEWIDTALWGYERTKRFYARTEVKNCQYLEQCKRIQLGNHSRPKLIMFNLFWDTRNDLLRVFIGPGHTQFNLVFATVFLITINYFMTIGGRIGFFSYYVPITPLLLILRNEKTFYAMKNTLRALIEASDVLILFFTYLVVCSLLGMALFYDSLNTDQSINNYSSFFRSVITSLVYCVTGESFNDLGFVEHFIDNTKIQ